MVHDIQKFGPVQPSCIKRDSSSKTEKLTTILIQDITQTACIGFQMAKKLAASNNISYEKRKKKILIRAFFQKIPLQYFFLHISWIWRALGHVLDIFSFCHFHNASKECFWPKKNQISCTGSKVPLLNPCMKFDIIFGQKHSFEAL